MNNRKTLLRQGAWYYLFFTVIVLLISIRYFKYFAADNTPLSVFYLFILTISHFAGLSFIPYVTIYLPVIAVFPKRRLAWILAGITSALGACVLYLDTVVFSLYRFHVNGFVLELLFGGNCGQTFQFSLNQYLLVSAEIIGAIVAILFLSYYIFKWQERISFKGGKWFIIGLALMMFSSHFLHAWADAANYTPITKSSRYYPLYFPTTSKELILKIGLVDSINNNPQFSSSEEAKDLNYPRKPLVMDCNCKTNVIVILIDSWKSSVLDSTTMPNIYAFSKRCEVYKHHYSGSNGTRTGVFSLFYSIPGTYWDDVLASKTGSILVDGLQKNQYDIKTLASATLTNPPFDCTIFRKVKNLVTDTKGESVCDRDNMITNEWLQLTAGNAGKDKPLFGFLFYDALHAFCHPQNSKTPFQPEWEYPKYEELNNNSDPRLFYNLYKNSAVYVDSLVGVVLRDIERRGLLKNSWVIITGDHGQEFNDNKKNFWGHNGNYTSAQMQVPLLVYKPNGQHKVYNHWTSHYDIVPTIFKELFHCKNAIDDFSIGKELADTRDRSWLLVGSKDNFAVVEPNKITSMYFDGSYDITDSKLNPLKVPMNTKLINQVLFVSKKYYRCQ